MLMHTYRQLTFSTLIFSDIFDYIFNIFFYSQGDSHSHIMDEVSIADPTIKIDHWLTCYFLTFNKVLIK